MAPCDNQMLMHRPCICILSSLAWGAAGWRQATLIASGWMTWSIAMADRATRQASWHAALPGQPFWQGFMWFITTSVPLLDMMLVMYPQHNLSNFRCYQWEQCNGPGLTVPHAMSPAALHNKIAHALAHNFTHEFHRLSISCTLHGAGCGILCTTAS